MNKIALVCHKKKLNMCINNILTKTSEDITDDDMSLLYESARKLGYYEAHEEIQSTMEGIFCSEDKAVK